jgi:hypothetical protein
MDTVEARLLQSVAFGLDFEILRGCLKGDPDGRIKTLDRMSRLVKLGREGCRRELDRCCSGVTRGW